MDNLNEHSHIAELLETLDQNGLTKEKTEVQSLVTYIGSMEETNGNAWRASGYASGNQPDPQQHFKKQMPKPCAENGR